MFSILQVEVSGDWANAKPMLGLVAQRAYNKLTPGKTIELNLSKGLFVVSWMIYNNNNIYYTKGVVYSLNKDENISARRKRLRKTLHGISIPYSTGFQLHPPLIKLKRFI